MTYMENQFDEIMERYGHDVLVLHHDKTVQCSCYKKVLGSVDRTCPFCFGMGYIPIIKRYTTRRIDGAISDTVPRSGNVQNFGSMVVENKHYYFGKDVPIKEQDLIIEVEWDGLKPVYKNRGVFEVDHVHSFKFEKGNVLYYKVNVKDKPVNKFIRGFNIAKHAGDIIYKLAERK